MMKPIAITMGDPTGIGPEVILKAVQQRPSDGSEWLYIGDPDLLTWSARHLNLELPWQRLTLLPTHHRVDLGRFQPGQPDPAHAAVIMECLDRACQLALTGEVAAITTAPIHKASLHAAGMAFPGHTEYLAHRTATAHPVMMLTGGDLRVVPATIHQSLASVAASLQPSGLQRVITTTLTALQRDFALSAPRIAVTGLNPHAGEQGSFGREEIEIIAPVCRQLSQQWPPGTICGPLSADSLFHASQRKGYDAIVCMYHDQALIPIKMLAFGAAVNVTLGLPIVRTSVDHGTAHDLAGRGQASPESLLQALHLAKVMAHNRLLPT
ncbi:MAG: 4-hydroxythreonine-4-phosphate dehydrogenase PdxA [Magnetococcales bacterium]|nr:4-hydroxythreonine-4-phosphate dehydrogenase PdxA [Magnetococcales bacterium]